MIQSTLTYTQQLPTESGYYWVLTPFDSTPMMELLMIDEVPDEDRGQVE